MTSDSWDNQYNADHIAMWVRWLQATGLDPEAIRDQIDKCSLGDVTMIYVAQHGRTMPTDFVRAIVERVLTRGKKLA
jgi:hypothetical protein